MTNGNRLRRYSVKSWYEMGKRPDHRFPSAISTIPFPSSYSMYTSTQHMYVCIELHFGCLSPDPRRLTCTNTTQHYGHRHWANEQLRVVVSFESCFPWYFSQISTHILLFYSTAVGEETLLVTPSIVGIDLQRKLDYCMLIVSEYEKLNVARLFLQDAMNDGRRSISQW